MKMNLKSIITLFILLLSLTSCKDKDKKYHWIAGVKAVSGILYSPAEALYITKKMLADLEPVALLFLKGKNPFHILL